MQACKTSSMAQYVSHEVIFSCQIDYDYLSKSSHSIK